MGIKNKVTGELSNITTYDSNGKISGITVSGSLNGNAVIANVLTVSNVANIHISGGANGQAIVTDGLGNLRWGNAGGGGTYVAIPAVYFVAGSAGNNQSFSNIVLSSYTANTDMTVFYNGALLPSPFYTLNTGNSSVTINTPMFAGDTIDIIQTLAGNVINVTSGYGNSNVAAYLSAGISTPIVTSNTIIAASFVGNGAGLTGLPSSYTNTNVTNLLASGNVTSNIRTTGNVSGTYFLGNGSQLTGIAGSYSDSNVTTLLSSGTVTSNVITTGNVSGGYVLGNGAFLTGIAGSYGNANVQTFLNVGAFAGDFIPNGNATQSLGNITNQWKDLWLSGNTLYLKQVPLSMSSANALQVAGSNVVTSTPSGNVNLAGNINAGGMLITGPVVITGNANVQGNLTYNNVTNLTTSNLILGLGNNQVGINVTGAGMIVGNTAEAQFLYSQPTQTWNTNLGITAVGNITGSYILGNGALLSGIATGYTNTNVTNLLASGNVANNIITTGNVSANNISATTNISSGNVTAANLNATTTVYSLNDVIVGNTANTSATKLRLTNFGAVSYIQTGNGTAGTTGNIVFAPYASANAQVRINTTNGDVVALGNIYGRNIGTAARANLSGTYTTFLNGLGDFVSPSTANYRDITKITEFGFNSALVIADKRLFCIKGYTAAGNWSDSWYTAQGQVGNYTMRGINNMYEITFPNEETGTLFDAGVYGPCAYALFDNGNLYTWGDGNQGALGLGNTTDYFYPQLSNTDVTQVFTHPSQCNGDPQYVRLIIQKRDGLYYACGYNGVYEMGLGNNTNQNSWVNLSWIAPNAQSVWNLGNYQGSIIVQQSDGSIWISGGNTSGQAGIGSYAQITVATNVASAAWKGSDASMLIQNIVTGQRYYDGGWGQGYNIVMWLEGSTGSRIVGAGDNTWGSLGDGTYTQRNVPTAPTGLTGNVSQMFGPGGTPMTVYVVMTNGDMYTWGYGGKYNLGDNLTSNRNTPYKVLTDVNHMWNDVQGWYGVPYACPSPVVQKNDGTTWCWGYNAFGQVGTGQIGGYVQTPTRMRLPIDIGIKYVATIGGNNEGIIRLIVTLDNHIYAYGYNTYNTIDSTSADHFYTPVQFSPSALLK